MADPTIVIEQAIRYFLNQWYCGLEPTLYLKTLSNGEICVNTNVKSLEAILNSQQLVRSHRRSGRHSRQRRSVQRSQKKDLTKPNENVCEDILENLSDVQTAAISVSDDFVPPSETDLVALQSPSVCNLPNKLELKITNLASIDIPPEIREPSLSNLSIVAQKPMSIPPRTIYHPAVIRACQSMFEKHPSQLSPEEITKYKLYQEYKLRNGEPPIEEDIIYVPSGMRNCLHCQNLT